jgi:hypothetical protein
VDTLSNAVMGEPACMRVDAVPGTPWRNGGGVTRELLAWPAAGDWRLRISVADIASDGPFSAFPGVQRWLTLLSGEGVALDLAGRHRTLRPGDAPLAFDGAAAPGCRLLGGPVRDLNLMCRGGEGGLHAVCAAAAWRPPAGAQAGLFARVHGQWHGGGQPITLAAHSLLWFADPPSGDWRFKAHAAPAAAPTPIGWWLHHRPATPTP